MPRRMRRGAWGTSTSWDGVIPNLGVRTFPYTYHGPAQPADKFLQEMADQVKARGVREVTGTLVADDSYFVWEPFAPTGLPTIWSGATGRPSRRWHSMTTC